MISPDGHTEWNHLTGRNHIRIYVEMMNKNKKKNMLNHIKKNYD